MKLVRQPKGSKLCGQACIATVCNITLEEAIELVGTKGRTNTKQLKAALGAKGIKHGDRRIRGFPLGSALLFWKSHSIPSRNHWTVWYNEKYYDPVAGVFRRVPNHLRESRVTSYLRLYLETLNE